jgi:hypothetical protein
MSTLGERKPNMTANESAAAKYQVNRHAVDFLKKMMG